LLRAVAFEGPVAIGYHAADGFEHYTSGIYNGTGKCNNTADHVNHAVVVVGYNHEQVNGTNVNYWIIKNSWGKDWGERGYFNMVRGVNMCGIATCASYPRMWG
jgi:C1A family cysteine protease